MKKIISLALIALLLPQIALGAFGVGWNATSTTQGWISPNLVNKVLQIPVAHRFIASYFTATSTATSSFSGPIALTKIDTSATSTGTNGFDISAGCYAVNGTCIGGGSGSGTVNAGLAGQLAYYASGGTALSGTTTNPLTAGRYVATSSTASIFPYASSTGLTVSGTADIGTIINSEVQANTAARHDAVTITDSTTIDLVLTGQDLTANGLYTAGDGLTLTAADFDCDTASGSVFGCLSAANWTTFNNKVSTSSLGYQATSTNPFMASFFVATSTGTSTFAGPVKTTKIDTSATSTGSNGFDITDGCFAIDGTCLADFSSVKQYPAFAFATSTVWGGTTTIPLGPAYVAETWVGAKCFTGAGTVNVSFYDGTNRMDLFNASTTVGAITFTTNNTFTASEKRYVDIGTPATSPTTISCSVYKTLSLE